MLSLTRREGESLVIDRPSLVTVLRVLGDSGKVKLTVEDWEPAEAKGLTSSRKAAYDNRRSPQVPQ